MAMESRCTKRQHSRALGTGLFGLEVSLVELHNIYAGGSEYSGIVPAPRTIKRSNGMSSA
jgi:hypothetical protein